MKPAPEEVKKEEGENRETWTFPQKLALRFGALYAALWIVFDQGSMEWITIPLNEFAAPLFSVAAPYDNSMTGSGDRVFDWLTAFWCVGLTLVGTAIWSVLDRKRIHYRFLYEALRIALRYVLATAVLGYGFVKLNQFPALTYRQMAAPLGSKSLMGLLWAFMGASPAYTVFSGVLEITGGFLLLFRRTTTLGALLVATVMLNVFVLNLCYDVPVKLYSFQLFLAAIALLIPDIARLLNVLVLNRPTQPRELVPSIRFPKVRVVVLVLKWIYFGSVLKGGLASFADSWTRAHRPASPIEGVWDVASFRQNGKELTTISLSDPIRWQRVAFERPYHGSGRVSVILVGGQLQALSISDLEPGDLRLIEKGASTLWSYRLDSQGHLKISGKLGGIPTDINLKPTSVEIPLPHASFHFIHATPRKP